ncbi:MAG: ABC transporter ATP-binding protein [Oscillospiraceae bacterium]|nr:ABC transporter ATP-binding protein [Oscillospiraceae bacterium]MDD6501922.1 ABC transporter ATP-binding protein [Oscillospiraceae bacterium]MDY4104103.1 ABC transporter ATP-binding protein [Oscillospiraceae bacterium]
MSYFEINNLRIDHHSFEGTRTVLEIDHLAIEKGETYGLVGESGQGKTVLALAIQQLLRCPPGSIESGEILLDGVDLLKLKQKQMQRDIRGGKIAMIFQDPMSCLNPVFTVGTIMTDVLRSRNRGMKKKAAQTRAMELLAEVKLADADSIMSKYPHQLSGGQRQRVIIALALACGAEFLIADEPTRNLDVTIQASILKLLKEIQEKHGMTVLFIANNLSLVSAFCDRVGILYGGKIIEENTTRALIESPREEYTKVLLDAVRTESKKAEPSDSGEVLLKVEHLKKYFDINDEIKHQKHLTLKAVDDVSFELKKGEVLGIVGESGCGKSTLVNTILNLFEPTDGKVYFEGEDVFAGAKKGDNAFKKNVQIVFQDPYWSLNPRWLIKDIVAEPLDVYEKLGEADRLKRVTELLEMVGIPADACYKYPHEFSGGQRQRIAIARSLASNPKLVVLDEPTSSIDVFSQAQILDLIKDLRRRFQLTNILISHDLGVVHELANKIAIMYLGKIVEFGPAEEIFSHPRHPYTKALFDSIPTLTTRGMEGLKTLEGQIPSPINPPPGCAFHQRCAYACERCAREMPQPEDLGGGHMVSCLRAHEWEQL